MSGTQASTVTAGNFILSGFVSNATYIGMDAAHVLNFLNTVFPT